MIISIYKIISDLVICFQNLGKIIERILMMQCVNILSVFYLKLIGYFNPVIDCCVHCSTYRDLIGL